MTSSVTPARPFADAVLAYAQAGWPCIMPVPLEKSPPPVGYTGADGADTDPMQLAIWAGTHAASSIALRMPDGIIGIDVDAYVKNSVTKHGDLTLRAAVERWGELPATWRSTARGGEGRSGISFYRVPAGRYATKLEGGDVEIIQRHHRYAVVWPSPHPDAGDIYRWYAPDGTVSEQPPKPGELPELPAAWIAGLAEGATDQGPGAAPREAGELLLAMIQADQREACPDMLRALELAGNELTAADAGSRHDTATERTHHLVHLAAHGHPGLGRVLPVLAELWEGLTAGEGRGDEWERMLLTSARKAVTVVGPRPVANDPCALTGGLTVAVQAGSAPGDDRPDATPDPEPPRARRELHPFDVIGTHPFTPLAQFDQTLADAVLERMYPVLRYATDAHVWLRRQPTEWEPSNDLTEWAIAHTADLMPAGDPDAEKGSDAREQAERRKRFMSAAPSGNFARKMRARVVGGGHPSTLRLADVDSEPWLLWAGGVGWDIGASLNAPTRAIIDSATPHLRSAGYAPEQRPTPLWDAFTAAVWPDPELRAWALRVLAIAFTGYSDKALPILIGEKDRGKTQVIALLMNTLGNYAHAADPRLLTSTDNTHASIVYALKGRRLSFIDEGPRDGKLGQERLKQLTGGGDLTGNEMRTNPITFTPTHTLVLTANDEPLLTDAAVRSRTRLIPCQGDPELVIAARAAIGHPGGAAWRREAPGVLAAMMREAAAWMAHPSSAGTAAAPEAYRWLAETIAAEQDPIGRWLGEETEAAEPGERSRVLYEAFIGWCRNGNLHPSRIPTETRWGRELTGRGHPIVHLRDGNHRPLRLRSHGGWINPSPTLTLLSNTIGEGSPSPSAGSVNGSTPTIHTQKSQEIAEVNEPEIPLNEGLNSSHPFPAPRTGAPAHTHAHESLTGTTLHPFNPSQPYSAQITARLLAGRGEPAASADIEAPAELPAKAKRTRVDPAVRAAEKAAGKTQARLEAIAAAAGELVQLPAVVTRDGEIRPVASDAVPLAQLFAAFGVFDEMTVDVETSGYPLGHADYQLRTVQLGNDQVAVVFDAADPEQLGTAAVLLERATVLHAHSATADLVPLAAAGALELADAWPKMHDTVIPALLADPQSTGSNAEGLKDLARDVLGENAATAGADDARAALFKAGGWLKETKATTGLERSGWAQVDRNCATMVRYAAADVLDTAALARVLPPVAPAVLERERTAQRMTARAAYTGIRLDGEHILGKLPEHRQGLADAGARIAAFGIDNPGSDQQIAAKLITLGAPLAATPTGRPSVAKGVLEPLQHADGPIGELVRARLDYQHHETVLGLFLEPYAQLVTRGDGRARPTVYTLGADTGRMSCVRPNLQQVPRQGGIRQCITADPGQVIVSADFASVEVRVAAALTGDVKLQEMIAADIDLHWTVARQAYGPDATKEDRYQTKRGVFGWLYGSSVAGVARTLGISGNEAAAIVSSLGAIAPQLVSWVDGLKQAVRRGLRTYETYSGRVVHIDQRLPHKAFNYYVQGTARELLVDTLVRWQDTRWGQCVLLPVHDEVLAFVPEEDAAEATEALVSAMKSTLYGVAVRGESSEPSFAWKDAS